MASNRVFVSPGVYTSEKDLTFVTRQVGVTTLGLVGETTKGPAFQPIFISNYDEFKAFFGGQNASKFIDTGFPQYELPYIAKSYLSQTNQLYVTRVLGLSGYDAGKSWGITLNGALDTSTTGITTTTGITIDYTRVSGSTVTGITTTPTFSGIESLFNTSASTYTEFAIEITNMANLALGSGYTGTTFFYKPNESTSAFVGILFTDMVKISGDASSVSGSVSGTVVLYSGTSYADVQNTVVALLRSRATYDGNENLLFELSGGSYTVSIDAANSSNALLDPSGEFVLSGLSTVQSAFTYTISLDNTNQNYITNALGTKAFDKQTAVFAEEVYDAMLDKFVADGKVRGINLSLVDYSSDFQFYKSQYTYATTPWTVSQVIGNQIFSLFRFITISDGNHANQEIKISIVNIKPDDKEFDILVRSFYDTDAKPSIIEKFTKCSMDPTLTNYVGRKIGTYDGEYPSKSDYILIEMNPDINTSMYFPAGMIGVPVRDYQTNGNTSVADPSILYKTRYGIYENKRKFYLGLSDTEGIDQPLFNYKGTEDGNGTAWTALTSGFHMDIAATGVTVDDNSISYTFECGSAQFRSELGVLGTDYEKVYARKFTMAPYGAYDGWDIYRRSRTNTNTYTINGTRGLLGTTLDNFADYVSSNGDNGITSDYYAYLEGVLTFSNPEAVNINVFATPGIDTVNNTNLVEDTINMVENDRRDSLYVVTTPDMSNGSLYTVEDIVADLTDFFDSNYSCTYWPWVQVNDTENNVYIWLPPTRDVLRNIALTDNIAFPWFSVAGIERGDVSCIKARKKLTLDERDTLYEGRINPIATFATEGVKIWGNKTLQVNETALNRINVRRLLLQTRKLISAVSLRLLFDQNDSVVRNKFLSLVNPILENIRSARGLVDFRVTVDNDPESIDRNELNGKIFIKPTRALEYINIEFVVTPTGASFDNI
jgi:hypothetical protein